MSNLERKLYLAITSRCNQNCLFCVRKGDSTPIEDLSNGRCKKLIADSVRDDIRCLIFDGGEPTLRDDLISLVSFAKEKGFKSLSILTNAVRLADMKYAQKLLPHREKINRKDVTLSVSLHSHRREISDYLTDSPGAFVKTIEGIHNAISLGARVTIYHVMTKQNYEDLYNFVKYIKHNFPDIYSITFSYIYPQGAALKNKHIFPSLTKMEPYLYKALNFCKKHNIFTPISTCGVLPLCFLKGYEEYAILPQKFSQPEDVQLIDSNQNTGYVLATNDFHEKSKIKPEKCSFCILNSLCAGLWRVYSEIYGNRELRPAIDKERFPSFVIHHQKDLEVLKKRLFNYRKIFILDFNFKKKINSKKILDFIEWVHTQKLNFLVRRPILLTSSGLSEELVKLGIPLDCSDCLDLFEINKGYVYFCNGAKANKIGTYKNRNQLFSEFKLSKQHNRGAFFKECRFRAYKQAKVYRHTKELSLIKKSVIFIGYKCNNNCQFCIGSEKKNLTQMSTNDVMRKMVDIKERGRVYLELIGGEPTIRSDIFSLIKFAKKLCFETIMITTNGRMLSYFDFAREIVNSGVTNIVFSVHGHTAKLHDSLTGVDGSFHQLLKGIGNLKKIGFDSIGTNTTIVKPNYRFLPKIGKLIYRLGIRNSEFIFVDPSYGGAYINFNELVPKISEAAPFMKDCLDIGRYRNSILHWQIRYVPLCYFLGYEDQISELHEVKTFQTEHQAPDFNNFDVEDSRAKIGRIKTKRCKGCKYYSCCEGMWREYILRYGDKELHAII
ncbi:MAG: radical SAM protein [Candidatus Omnitrophica bacterium]|nr:radical SAM protein [Candidatus Omnitrophota bacterium]MDD5352610.1 radical SAM protein [Candidatus Omnitrophota bacterium]MDD5550208.1 radical SAM protein [Candidatus Omnitrophota bacterium]